jgi:queuosine precursor transporter
MDKQPHFAKVPPTMYTTLVVLFVAFLLLSNISAVKLIAVGPLVMDGGIFLFPLVYILGDVLAEVYGFAAARRAVLLGFAIAALAAVTFWIVQVVPAADGWENQEAWESVLGFVPRIVVASLCGFLVGQLLNAYVLVWIKRRTDESRLWFRLLGSTVVGQIADTVTFCTIAFYGVITGAEFLNYVVTGYFYKTLIEAILLPITYRVIAYIKRNEPTYTQMV